MKNLKLNKLNNSQLSKKQMKSIIGGMVICCCGCCYENSGGSSVNSNANANSAHGLESTDCYIKRTIYTWS